MKTRQAGACCTSQTECGEEERLAQADAYAAGAEDFHASCDPGRGGSWNSCGAEPVGFQGRREVLRDMERETINQARRSRELKG